MDGTTSSIIVGCVLLVIDLTVRAVQALRTRTKNNMDKTDENERRICDLEQAQKDTHELIKLSLRMSMILGDGMVQGGVNGNVKVSFEKMKEEIITKL